MTRHLFIVTGSSRGMGAAMAAQLLSSPDHSVLGIARRLNPDLPAVAKASGAKCEQWQLDLTHSSDAAAMLNTWLARTGPAVFETATLINNAAMLTQIGPIDECSEAELAASLRLGLETPMLLAATFLRATRDWTAARRVLNVSSGLGRRAMAGQAPYCASKAGLDHLSRAMALDEANRPNGARVVALAPGVIDTDMQAHLRAGDETRFPEKDRFVGLKAQGQLTSEADAAARVLAYLQRSDFGASAVADVRDT